MLEAHEAGLYRCVVRVIFPEIERILQKGRFSYKEMVEGWVNTHDDLSDLLKEKWHSALLGMLINHVYKNVPDSELQNFRENHCPNRHAALHGLVIYSTFKHSMNMIIITNYILQIHTSTAKDRKQEPK